MSAQLARDGFFTVRSVLSLDVAQRLADDIESRLPRVLSAGVRGLHEKVPSVGDLAHSGPVRELIEPLLGTGAQLVRSIFFSKSEQVNWRVPWHQDLAIAVQARVDVPGFGSWSMKEGVPHVQPPREILENMLAVRFHLDAADETNGALWVAPGSHRFGRLPANEAARAADRCGKHLCSVAAGDALMFRPLLVHASRKATSLRPRRVIHLEFSGVKLPEPLAWATAL